jgi:hypothetical protein
MTIAYRCGVPVEAITDIPAWLTSFAAYLEDAPHYLVCEAQDLRSVAHSLASASVLSSDPLGDRAELSKLEAMSLDDLLISLTSIALDQGRHMADGSAPHPAYSREHALIVAAIRSRSLRSGVGADREADAPTAKLDAGEGETWLTPDQECVRQLNVALRTLCDPTSSAKHEQVAADTVRRLFAQLRSVRPSQPAAAGETTRGEPAPLWFAVDALDSALRHVYAYRRGCEPECPHRLSEDDPCACGYEDGVEAIKNARQAGLVALRAGSA